MFKMPNKAFCPHCGGDNIIMSYESVSGGWKCKDCGHNGIFPEKGEHEKNSKVMEDLRKMKGEMKKERKK